MSNIINFTLNGLLEEIKYYIEAQVVQVDEKEPKKSKFGGFFGEESDDDEGGLIDFDNLPPAGAQKKQTKVEEEPPADNGYERKFLDIFEDLLKLVNMTETVRSKELIDFILIFKQIQNKDFFSDEMAFGRKHAVLC